MCRHLRRSVQFAVRKYKLALQNMKKKHATTLILCLNGSCEFLCVFSQTVLHWAAKHGNEDVVKLFAGKYKANVNAKTVRMFRVVFNLSFYTDFFFACFLLMDQTYLQKGVS